MGNKYEPNTRVEIIDAEEGLRGSYHTAIVIARLRPAVYYRICYELLTDDEGAPLVKDVPEGLIRPIPPTDHRHVFVVGDHVDMWCRDGWWYGLIEAVADAETHRFLINFSPFGYDNVITDVSHLRRHMNYLWEQNDWLTATPGIQYHLY